MEIREMDIFQLETRMSELTAELEKEDANLDEIRGQMDAIEERKAQLETEAKEAEELRAAAAKEVNTVKSFEEKEERAMTNMEMRNTNEYINAFAEYIKSGNDAECRALLTENVPSGTVPVPELVYDEFKTAWENDGIMSRVRKTYMKGNVKIGFEIDADGAVVHTEGSGAVTEEDLDLGIVTLVPATIKKWISVSDEAMAMSGEAFLRYVYAELAHQIAKKAADVLVAKLAASPETSTATAPAVAQIVEATPGVGTVAKALGALSDQAARPTVMMNKLTWSVFKAAQYANGYGVDPFEGLDVVFNNTIPAYADVDEGEAYMYVGDLDYGAMANFPNGEDIKITIDELTLATSDLVRIIGRMFAGIGVVAPNAFVAVLKEAASA